MAEGAAKSALSKLALIFAIDQLFAYTKQGLETDTLNQSIINFCVEIYEELLEEVHVDALVLAEGFGYPDSMVNSTIGNSNGKPYENLYQHAKKHGLLNKFDVHPVMEEYIANQYKDRPQDLEELSKPQAKL